MYVFGGLLAFVATLNSISLLFYSSFFFIVLIHASKHLQKKIKNKKADFQNNWSKSSCDFIYVVFGNI